MNLIRTFELVSGMADVRRYSMIRLTASESVLEHTAFVVMLSYLITLEINARNDALMGGSIDVGEVLARAVMHDVEEVVTGDIPRPTKYFSVETRAMFRMIEDKGTLRLLSGLEMSDPARTEAMAIRDASKTGREGLIVDIVDTLAVVYKSWDEVLLRGNQSMRKVAASTLPDIARLAVEVTDQFGDGAVAHYLIGLLEDAKTIAERATAPMPWPGPTREET